MKRIAKSLLVIAMFVGGLTATAQEKIITQDQLPKEAMTFVNKHFSGNTIEYAIMEKNYVKSDEYKVRLSGGTEVEFNQKGEWKEINGHLNEIPTEFIDKNILNYVNSKFANTKIVKIEKGDFGKQEVKLSNGLELQFDSKGNFVRVDD